MIRVSPQHLSQHLLHCDSYNSMWMAVHGGTSIETVEDAAFAAIKLRKKPAGAKSPTKGAMSAVRKPRETCIPFYMDTFGQLETIFLAIDQMFATAPLDYRNVALFRDANPMSVKKIA